MKRDRTRTGLHRAAVILRAPLLHRGIFVNGLRYLVCLVSIMIHCKPIRGVALYVPNLKQIHMLSEVTKNVHSVQLWLWA